MTRLIYIYGLLLIALANTFCSCSMRMKAHEKPNVIIVLTDDQGWGDVGFNGNQIINTPTLDSLATVGAVFNRFYVSPVCAPTRASILTGKYHLATGTSWVTHRKEVMRKSEITLAEVLKDNGYTTAYFGKWHNGQDFPHNPNGQGFTKYFGFSAGHINNYFDAELEYNGEKVATQGYITDILTDSVLNFISNTDKPFLAYVAYNTPHTPYQVSDKYFDKYKHAGLDDKTAAIYGMCENIDDNVLRIQNTLKKTRKNDNTIFIFLSDNGPNYVRYNGGFKGRKAQVDEGGVRVPFIISYPNGHIIPREVTSDFAAHIDIFPTVLDLCSISSNEMNFDGKSFASILIDSTQHLIDRKFYTHQIFNEESYASAVRTNKYLLTCYPNDTALYNLNEDPYQIVNIWRFEPQVCDSLTADFSSWLNRVTIKGLEPESIELGHLNHKIVELPAHESTLGKHLKFKGEMGWANDWVINWTDTNDTMQWPVYVDAAGVYNFKLKYSCKAENSGDHYSLLCQNKVLNFEIENAIVKTIVNSPDRVKRDEVAECIWATQDIGELSLQKGHGLVTLKYAENTPNSMEVKGLEIVSVNKK